MTTSVSLGSLDVEVSQSMDSRTSTALPAVRPSTWFMSVSSAFVTSPAVRATVTMLWASSSAEVRSVMKAPLPNLTSITSASSPAESFFDRIEAVISGIDSTVAVTSRIAYRRPSAGARFDVCPMIAQPTSATTLWNSSLSGRTS